MPLILSWAERGLRFATGQRRRAAGLALLQLAILIVVVWHVFSGQFHFELVALDSPFLIYAVLLWIVSTGGTRRSTSALLTVGV